MKNKPKILLFIVIFIYNIFFILFSHRTQKPKTKKQKKLKYNKVIYKEHEFNNRFY